MNAEAVGEALGASADGFGRHDVYDDCLHFSVGGLNVREDGLVTAGVDTLLGASYLVTLRRGEVDFLQGVRRTYRQDFLTFARTSGFLLYGFWDHLLRAYKKAARALGDHVRAVQDRIFGEVDDTIFAQVAEVSRSLLNLRRTVLASREVLSELSTRRSTVVTESTQPFLDKMVAALERIGADLAVEREILAETLNLYMGIVAHRTNKVVNRLTVVSLVFLPLTFLCGVYGMNFRVLPEVEWKYGYAFFWVTATFITVTSLVYMKKKKWW